MAENEDKRKYKRVDKDLEVMISLPATDEFEKEFSFLKGRSVNISEGGILFTFKEEIVPDTEIELTLFLPDSADLINLRGEVKRVEPWRNKFKIAVEFVEYIKNAREQLRKLFEG